MVERCSSRDPDFEFDRAALPSKAPAKDPSKSAAGDKLKLENKMELEEQLKFEPHPLNPLPEPKTFVQQP